MRRNLGLGAVLLLAAMPCVVQAQHSSSGRTFYVDCGTAPPPSPEVPAAAMLRSLDAVNALSLEPNDALLFHRGTLCQGSLHPKGSGFSIDAYGRGALPRIEARATDEATLRLFNQDHISIASLELRGGTTYGISISGDQGTMRSIRLSNLTVHDVRGVMKHKESGLIVIKPASPTATFEDIHLDGIRAFDTTLWSGIFIEGASLEHPATNVTVKNSVVHDVQGDGIVLFNARNSSIEHSVAWHTGMQHQLTIGTPNAIWTWQCNQCVVSENEAFLTDSPGIDGGAFDIDWGNTLNTVQHNFGHDTQGYCVSIFAANGPTKQSLVDGNLCLNNGMSPRLAQRQGAILLMTWNGGSLDGLTISNNRVDWHPPGNTPAIQSGSKLDAEKVFLTRNDIHSGTSVVVDPVIHYTGTRNRYFLERATAADVAHVQEQVRSAGETATMVEQIRMPQLHAAATHGFGWQLTATVTTHTMGTTPDLATLFVNLKTAAAEYGHSGLKLSLSGDADLLQAAGDWELPADGIQLKPLLPGTSRAFSLKLITPNGGVVQDWNQAASPIDLGLELRNSLGAPDYSRLGFENVRATD